MKNVAFVTELEWPQLTGDDRLLIKPLKNLGVTIVPVIWDGSNIDWRQFDAIVFRSCWHYYRKINDFKTWLENLAVKNKNIWNPVKVLKWNIDKRYLLELKDLAIDIVPTYRNFREIENKSSKYIIKPIYGSNSHNVSMVQDGELKNISADYVIQPYIEEIATNGELSFIFINNQYSHTMRKIPKKGEFRTGDDYRPKWLKEEDNENNIKIASEIIAKLKLDTLYARVDMVEAGDKLLVMEVEMTEPFLYLGWHKPSLDLFAKALVSKMS